MSGTPRDQVFFSYSHQDTPWLDRLVAMLDPLVRKGMKTWSDRDIVPGSLWEKEIQNALDSAKVAVFLVSANPWHRTSSTRANSRGSSTRPGPGASRSSGSR